MVERTDQTGRGNYIVEEKKSEVKFVEMEIYEKLEYREGRK